jgi:2-polyprenyl-6-methoxyphenol hydroxylase-like FAD-dependent oxidoreductase
MAVRGHAVVIGGSIAGLLAARVLSESFDQVTVFERDELPAEPQPRRGVPQGRQVHALHARGADALGELLDGFWADMVGAGGLYGDAQADARWYLDGYLLKPAPCGLIGIALSRPVLEHLIRTRVAALPGVRIVEATDVTGLVAENGMVTGVLTRPARDPDGSRGTVAADLVVDAAGRGSRAPSWLAGHGFPVPRSSELRSGVVYVSRPYSAAPGQLDGRLGGLVTPYPGEPRGALALRQEGGRFIVLLAGLIGVEPPMDDAGMLAFADELACPEVSAVLRESMPLGPAVKMRYPVNIRRHFEDLGRYLGGFVVLGDAMCSLNPVYGQGITVAALEALELRRLLGEPAGTADLPRRFFHAAAKPVAIAWETSTSGDLRFPEIEGKRQLGAGIINAYLARYRAAASVDPVLGRTFLRVANMMDAPARLLAPGHVLRVLRHAHKGIRTQPRAAAGQRQDAVAQPGLEPSP